MNQFIVVLADVLGAVCDLSNVSELIEYHAGIGIDVAYDVRVAAAVYGLREGPRCYPVLQLRQAADGTKRYAGRTALH